VTEMT